MAAALVVPAQTMRGSTEAITGTGFAITTPIVLTISNPDATEDITVTKTSDGAGAIDFSTILKFAPEHSGVWKFSATDGTSTVVAQTQVFED
jgi:hypothetical protein